MLFALLKPRWKFGMDIYILYYVYYARVVTGHRVSYALQ